MHDLPKSSRAPSPLAGALVLGLLGGTGFVALTLVSGGGFVLAALAYAFGGSLSLLAAAGLIALRPVAARAARRRRPAPRGDDFATGLSHG